MSQSDMGVEAHGHGVIVVHQESEWVEALVPWPVGGIGAGPRALMVSRGEERAASDIKRLSQEMTASQPVSLHCVYATDVLSPADLGLVRQIFDLHTTVAVNGAGTAPSTPPAAGAVVATPVDHRVELFPGVPQSTAKVRRIVAHSLDQHHPLGVVLDCSLIASEMATHAYRHADRSPFRVGVRFVPGRVRITVKDTSITPPSMPHPLEHDEGGRGVANIDALSDRWAADSLPGGKVVLAEVLTASRSSPAPEAQRA